MSNTVFISYASENSHTALRLARFLQRQGGAVWLDPWHHPQTKEWDRQRTDALRNCAVFLVILSPAARDSWLVRDQTLLALEYNKPVVLVLIQTCQPPPALADFPLFNLTGQGSGFQTEARRLVTHLTGGTSLGQMELYRLHLALSWDRLRGQPQFLWPIVVTLLLLLWSGVVTWPSDQSEPVPGPGRASPVSLAQPILVPDTDIIPTPKPEPTPIDIEVRPRDGQVMVYVPAGEFLRGSASHNRDADEDEMPQRLIYLDAFWIDKTEINNAQYRRCVADGACTPSSVHRKVFQAAQSPVVGVNWDQAAAYCRWAGARLPTEAQWEKAARGANGRLYPWGNEFDGARLNYCDANCIADWRDPNTDDGYRFTAPIGVYPAGASPYGALDMSGNVWEWTADWYAPDAYASAPYRNPTGPATGRQRVIRGGSWLFLPKSLRTAKRHKEAPTYSYDNIGFRCAMPAKEAL